MPGAICGAAAYLGSDEDQKFKALLAAGIIGVCMADGNNFMGGEFGCQTEVGCAAAMAADALVQMLGGTPQQACDSASMALQCLLGTAQRPRRRVTGCRKNRGYGINHFAHQRRAIDRSSFNPAPGQNSR